MTVLWFSLPLSAQADVDHELQDWNMVTLRVDAPKKISVYAEVQPRTGLGFRGSNGDREKMEMLILRGAVGYRIKPWMSLWQGYAWVPATRPEIRHENRLFQQLLLENKIKKLSIVNRTRLEERMIEDAGGTSVRLRHMLRLSHPIDKAQKWSGVVYGEYFVNFNSVDNGPTGGFDQNRVFVGVNRKFGKAVNAELGYMGQYVNRHQGLPDKLNHAVLLTLNVHFK